MPAAQHPGTEIERREGLWVLDVADREARFFGLTEYSHARFTRDRAAIVSKQTWTSIDEYPLDGSDPRRLVSCDGFGCDEPELSPDGSLLRYFDWHRRVHVVSHDGTPRHVLSAPDPDHGSIDGYAFAPDGERAAWSTNTWDRIDELGGGQVEAHIVATDLRISRVDGSEGRVVATGSRYLFLEWSPDGRYLSWFDGKDQLFVMDATNDSVRHVVVPSGPAYGLAWTPDALFVGGTALWRFGDRGGAGSATSVDVRGSQVHAAPTGDVVWQRRPSDGFATPGNPNTSPVTVGRRDARGATSTAAWIGDSWSLEVVDLSRDGRYVALYAIAPWWR